MRSVESGISVISVGKSGCEVVETATISVEGVNIHEYCSLLCDLGVFVKWNGYVEISYVQLKVVFVLVTLVTVWGRFMCMAFRTVSLSNVEKIISL